MAKGKPPRFDLVKDKKNDDWALKRGDKVVERFDTRRTQQPAVCSRVQ